MRDRKLDRLFDRYRHKGDVDALGEVFDATAQELLRVAMSLVHDPVEADDLLQATYLTAIEKAEAYDSRRRLVPWLLGVLVHHAHDQRRRRGRTLDPARLVEREVEGPAEIMDRIEVAEVLTTAIAALPAHYREVLEPFVAKGKKAAEIAREIGRPPGTVRMRIHRGLDLLRKALPVGLSLGALLTTAGPGLGAVRAEVLRQAATRVPALAAGAAASTTILGGWTMAQKAALVSLTVAVVSGIAWMATSGAAPEGDSLASVGDSAGPDTLGGVATLTPSAAGIEAPPDTAAPTAAPETRVGLGTESASFYERSLSGVTGRVVEEDGSPVAGISLELLELGFDRLDSNAADVFEDAPTAADWTVARATTDAGGRFRMGGARAHALHGVSVDPAGARPHFQIVDTFLVPGEATELGDIVLPAYVPARGRIVDAQGEPIAGVRLRASNLNTDFEWERFAKLDTDDPVYVQLNDFLGVMAELPGHARGLRRWMPFHETESGADGSFELATAPAGPLQVIVDHPEYLGRLVAGTAPSDGVRELGDVVLERGRTFQGRVVDGAGEPVEGAEVRAGAMFEMGWFGPELAPLATVAVTDADGRFELSGVKEEGTPVFVARYDAEHPWVVRKPKDPTFVVIDLPSEYPVTVLLEDERGEPVESAELAVFQPSLVASAVEWGSLVDARKLYGTIERRGPGHYEILGLQKGSYVVRGRVPGFGIAEARLAPRARGRDATLVFRPERALAVTVTDAESGAAVARVEVSVIADREHAHALSRATTTSDGTARLPGLPAELGEDAYLRIEHPHYASRNLPLDQEEGETIAVELDAGGGLLARCRANGNAPPGPLVIELDLPRKADFANDYTKRFSVSDATGDISFSHLPPGTWRYRVFERYLNGDIWPLLTYEVDGVSILASGEVQVLPGAVAEVDIDLSGHEFDVPLPEGTATIRGVVLRDGKYAPDAWIQCEPRDLPGYEAIEVRPDGSGAYALTGLPAGRYALELWESTKSEQGWSWSSILVTREFELEEGATHTADFRLHTTPLEVFLVDEDGEPVSGGRVHLTSTDDDGVVNQSQIASGGKATFVLRDGGPLHVLARCGELGMGSTEVEVTPGEGNDPVYLTVVRGKRVAGTVRVPADTEMREIATENMRMTFTPVLQFQRADEPQIWNSCTLDFAEDAATFDVAGLEPGTWNVNLIGNPHDFESQTIVVGDADQPDTELSFTFAPEDQDE